MRYFRLAQGLVVSVLLQVPPHAATAQDPPMFAESARGPAGTIVSSLTDLDLRTTLQEVADRNPAVRAATARAEAASRRAPQVSSLPDPQAEVTVFAMPPETRVGPQRLSARLAQQLPPLGTLKRRERVAALEAAAAAAEVDALRLRLVTDARRLCLEIAYVDGSFEILGEDRQTLEHFEELARARYASGVGIQQEVVRIQAEISRVDTRLAELAARRAALVAEVNELRDRSHAELGRFRLPPTGRAGELDWDLLSERALATRPELSALAARRAAAEVEVELARREGQPDFMVGVMWALVDPRTDADPPGNGDDDVGIMGGLSLPIWRSRVAAAVEEASWKQLAADADVEAEEAAIARELGDLRGRIPEIERQLTLFEGVLQTQAEQSLHSAEAAYATGRLDAVALLDAERTVLDVRLASERSRADLLIALASLEGAVAGPLPFFPTIGDDR
jgi:outer membrane protein TolC